MDGRSLYEIILQDLFVSSHCFLFCVRIFTRCSLGVPMRTFRIALTFIWHAACMQCHKILLFSWSLLYQSPLRTTSRVNYFGSSLHFHWSIVLVPPNISSFQRLIFLKAQLFAVIFMRWYWALGVYFFLDCCVIGILNFRFFQQINKQNSYSARNNGCQ